MSKYRVHDLQIIRTFTAFEKPSFRTKRTFRGIFQPFRGHTDRCCFDMGIYERSASMNLIWYSCQNIHGLEIICTFTAFEKLWFIRKTSFRVIFEPNRGRTYRCCFDMVIFERSAPINVIWYSCGNIHGLKTIWTFTAFENPWFIRKTSFRVIF